MCHLTRIFLKSIIIDISESICWNKEDYYIGRNSNVNPLENTPHKITSVSSSLKRTSTLIDNPLLVPSQYPILQFCKIIEYSERNS